MGVVSIFSLKLTKKTRNEYCIFWDIQVAIKLVYSEADWGRDGYMSKKKSMQGLHG